MNNATLAPNETACCSNSSAAPNGYFAYNYDNAFLPVKIFWHRGPCNDSFSGVARVWKSQNCIFADASDEDRAGNLAKTAKIIYEQTTEKDLEALVLAYDVGLEVDVVYDPYSWDCEICLVNAGSTTVTWAIGMTSVHD